MTSVGADGRDQSPPSAADTCSNNLFDDGAYNSLSWSPVAGATRYNVFRLGGGLYGYIGQTAGTTFVDQGGGDVVTPDISRTRRSRRGLRSAGNYLGRSATTSSGASSPERRMSRRRCGARAAPPSRR